MEFEEFRENIYYIDRFEESKEIYDDESVEPCNKCINLDKDVNDFPCLYCTNRPII